MALPMTVIAPPHQAPEAGWRRYTIHKRGSNTTGAIDEKMATKLAGPVFKACRIKVMPITMDTLALSAVFNSDFQFNGLANFDNSNPAHKRAKCATKLAVALTAEAETASIPVLIKGLIMRVATA